MKLVLLGTGTPNCEPFASGPSSAVIVKNRCFLIDFGPGVIRQASKAFFKGISELRPDLIDMVFCTHLHSDHTAGLSDLVLSPWVLERNRETVIYGPKGLRKMADAVHSAYETDIDFRINGFEKANDKGHRYVVNEIEEEGIIYKDEDVTVSCIRVEHGLESFAFRFESEGRSIVISGDTCPLEKMSEFAKDADILLHEVEYEGGLKDRDPKWQRYHREVHTMSSDLSRIACAAGVRKLVTYHRIYHLDIYAHQNDLNEIIDKRDGLILEEIRAAGYENDLVNGHDLDVFEI